MIAASAQTGQYKPKTNIIRGEIVAPGEFFGVEIHTDRLMPKVKPGQSLIMRRGCLAEVGNIVAWDDAGPSRVGLYAEGMDYCAVCIAIETDYA